MMARVYEYKSFSFSSHSRLTSETAVLTAKHFYPQESDEDFASRSDNDQNQVKLTYWNEFILKLQLKYKMYAKLPWH